MPYIDKGIRELAKRVPESAGELNYCITEQCHFYIIQKELSYEVINEVIGVLESVKLELYRQIAAPYENKKKKENGPISQLDKESDNE